MKRTTCLIVRYDIILLLTQRDDDDGCGLGPMFLICFLDTRYCTFTLHSPCEKNLSSDFFIVVNRCNKLPGFNYCACHCN